MIDWSDLRYFAAVAETGSTLAASRRLRVSQTTVARRIAALEEAVGLTLFDRRQSGYVLTPAGESLLGDARQVGKAGDRFEETAAAIARKSGGDVRMSTSDIFANTVLPPWLAELHDLHPEVRLELDETDELRDLGSGEADIALRSIEGPTPDGVVGRRLCFDAWTFYCSRDYADRHGIPRNREELRGHALVGGGGEKTWRIYQSFLQHLGIDQQVAIRQTTMTGLLTGIRSGLGVGVLPCFVADGEPDLIRCTAPSADQRRTLWLMTHERVRREPAVRTVIDFLYERLKARLDALGLA